MRKHKLTVLSVSVLGALGVISSGFAGWVISSGDQSGTGKGTISVDAEVTRTGIKEVTATQDATVSFSPKKSGVTTKWLSASGSTEEKLAAEISVTVTAWNTNTTVKFSNLSFTEKSGTYASAVTKGVVGTLPSQLYTTAPTMDATNPAGYILVPNGMTLGSDGTSATVSTGDSATVIVKFTVTFVWGKNFEGKNPLEYYNAKNYDSILDSAAAENLGENGLGLIKNAAFEFSFSVSAAA